MGVATSNHVSIRTWMPVKFPVIADRDGDLSSALGVLHSKAKEVGAARAIVILDKDIKLRHLSVNSEMVVTTP